MICTDHKRCSSRPSADRPKCDLERFSSCSFVALRGQKEVAVAVAVLRGPPCPPRTNVLPLQFFVVLRGPSWTKGSCSRRCSSPRPSVSSVDKGVAVAGFLRVPSSSWTKGSCSRRCSPRPSVSSADKCVAVAGLRVPSWPFVDKRKLQSPLQFSAALRVLRGQRCCRCSSSWPSVALRGQMCCRCRSSWSFVALRGQMCCRCSSPRPSVSSVDKCVAVAVLRGPSWIDQTMTLLISVQTNVNEP